MAGDRAVCFLDQVATSRLVPRPVVERLRNSDVARAPQMTESQRIDAYAGALVDGAHITSWQRQQLLGGKTRGYFLDGWRILEPLARGGMSRVFLAEHVRLGKRAAVKVLPSDRTRSEVHLAYFRQEIRLLSKLEHPHIVQIYDAGATEGIYYLAMELLKGIDLHDYVVKNGPLPEWRAAQFLLQAADALEYVHRRGLVHRDVKPANLWLDESDHLRLIDFGLAWSLNPAEISLRPPAAGVIGTADFIAPEQASQCDDLDQRADLYGLGATLYFWLTGRPPFPNGTIQERLERHRREEPAPIASLRPAVDPFFAALCHRLLAKRAVDRLPSARIVRRLVQTWLSDGALQEKSALWANSGWSGIWRGVA